MDETPPRGKKKKKKTGSDVETPVPEYHFIAITPRSTDLEYTHTKSLR